MHPSLTLSGYDISKLSVAVLGGHSALDVAHGAKQNGFRTLAVTVEGRSATYAKYFRTNGDRGCIDETFELKSFQEVLEPETQEWLRERNAIFIHNRYFWVYVDEFEKVEKKFMVPMFGSRSLLKLEERDQPYNQYHLLADAGIRSPKIFKSGKDIDRPVLVKASEPARGYERAFFFAPDAASYERIGSELEKEGKVGKDWRNATIEEFIVGAPVNFNFFYSPLSGELELLGTDTRRQTNLDGFLRLPSWQQEDVRKAIPLKMIETGHIAVTVKESILEKAFDLGEKFVAACKKIPREIDPDQKGIIGPFALQGAVVAEDGREDIVIFDVSLRIPGSPGIAATPYGAYLYGHPMSMGERIGMELRRAADTKCMELIVT